MTTFTIDFRNEEELISKLQNSPKKLRKSFISLVTRDLYNKVVKEATGTKRKEGDYKGGFTYKIGSEKGEIYTDLKWAKYVHDGTGEHVISAKNGGVLHFTLNGEEVFCKSVQHPGYEGRHDIPKGIKKVEPRLEGLFERACKEVDL